MEPGGTVRPFSGEERAARSADLVRCGGWFLGTMWAIASYDLAARLGRIDLPTFVLMGEQDFHLATSYVLADGIRDARLAVIPNSGHLTPYDAPDEVADHLVSFFRDRGGLGAATPSTTRAQRASVSSGFRDLIARAGSDSGFRGKMVWFPEDACREYGLDGPEAKAVRTGDLSGLDLDEDLAVLANNVFDLHDLHSGE
jgi:hypothetical protein